MTEQYVHVDVSQNSRMSELEAAWLRLVLPDVRQPATPAARDDRRALPRPPRPTCAGTPTTRATCTTCASSGCPTATASARRLADAGVATAVHYPLAITQQPAYAPLHPRAPCPEAEAWAAECVTVPCFPELHRRRGGHGCARPRLLPVTAT